MSEELTEELKAQLNLLENRIMDGSYSREVIVEKIKIIVSNAFISGSDLQYKLEPIK